MDKLIEEGEVSDAGLRVQSGILWDFSVYHSRWIELGYDDFYPSASKEKGAQTRVAVATPREIIQVPSDSYLEEETLGVQYLRKMIEECQEKGIEVLLVYLPFPPQEQDFLNANRMYKIADEYGVDYINFLDMDIVDYSTDCYDEGSHLNPSGARKVTDYLGQYIMEHYEIKDQRENDAYADWHDAYKEYEKLKESNLKEQQDLDNYLMLLADKNYDVMIEICDLSIWGDLHYWNLMSNLGVDLTQISPEVDRLVVEQGGKTVSYYMDSRDMEAETPENACVHLTVRDSDTWEGVDDVYFCIQEQDDTAGQKKMEIKAAR